jgi:hypothetical protein
MDPMDRDLLLNAARFPAWSPTAVGRTDKLWPLFQKVSDRLEEKLRLQSP